LFVKNGHRLNLSPRFEVRFPIRPLVLTRISVASCSPCDAVDRSIWEGEPYTLETWTVKNPTKIPRSLLFTKKAHFVDLIAPFIIRSDQKESTLTQVIVFRSCVLYLLPAVEARHILVQDDSQLTVQIDPEATLTLEVKIWGKRPVQPGFSIYVRAVETPEFQEIRRNTLTSYQTPLSAILNLTNYSLEPVTKLEQFLHGSPWL
jgi:hypothetical protein